MAALVKIEKFLKIIGSAEDDFFQLTFENEQTTSINPHIKFKKLYSKNYYFQLNESELKELIK